MTGCSVVIDRRRKTLSVAHTPCAAGTETHVMGISFNSVSPEGPFAHGSASSSNVVAHRGSRYQH